MGESAMFFLQLFFLNNASLSHALKTKLQSHIGTRGTNLQD